MHLKYGTNSALSEESSSEVYTNIFVSAVRLKCLNNYLEQWS